jgi:prophage regulatory protein
MPAVYNRLIRLPEVLYLTGLSRSALYRLEKAGAFTGRVRLSARAAAWKLDAVQEWIESRPYVVGDRSRPIQS